MTSSTSSSCKPPPMRGRTLKRIAPQPRTAWYVAGSTMLCVLVATALLPVCAVPSVAQEHSTAPIEVAEPADYRMNDFRSPVPKTLKGARVVDAAQAAELAGQGALMIDVYPRAPKPAGLPANAIWRSPKHMSIKGAVWLPNVGFGKLANEPEEYFRKGLERLTGNTKDKAIVFFCLKDCWMSWNAAKRAIEWGYTNVIWFPDGTDGWQEIGNELANAEPEPGGG